MGKSKNGGTRSFLRGRVGSDVYSVGKDSKGQKQQVVRSLAESVANPQTSAQMRGRAIMSTVMQAVSALAQVIDHSFDNVAVGQPNVSEFIRRNYALVKADVAANPASGNAFGIVKYGEKGAKRGAYVISDGNAYLPTAFVNAADKATLSVAGGSLSVAAIKGALGLGDSEYFTLVGLTANGTAEIARFRIADALSDDTIITADNINELFAIEANIVPAVAVAGSTITFALPNAQANSAIIISKLKNGAFIHNSAELLAVVNPDFTFNVAIATYPVGSARLLNGGDFAGGEVTPEPTPAASYALTINKGSLNNVAVTVDGSAVTSGQSIEAGKEVAISISDIGPGESYTATINGSSITLSGEDPLTGSFSMPAQASTLAISVQS